MKNKRLIMPVILAFVLSVHSDTIATWSLQKCIDVAIHNNIQIKSLRLDSLESQLTYKASKAALYPRVDGSISYSVSPDFGSDAIGDRVSQNAQYSINADWTVFKGKSLVTDVEMKKLGIQKSSSSIKSKQTELILAVTKAYVQILYSREDLQNAIISRDASLVQKERTAALLATGAASQVQLARMEASLAADEYSVVTATNTCKERERDLKKLLQIPLDTSINLMFPNLSDSTVFQKIPSIEEIFKASLDNMPQIENAKLNTVITELAIKKAKASYYPSVSINSRVSTRNTSGKPFSDQFVDNADISIGAGLSVPIYDNLKNRTSVENAKLEAKRAELTFEDERNALYEDVQNAYYDADASKSKFEAARRQLDGAQQSYEIAQEQFKLGMLNPTELLVEKNAYLKAAAELLQSKFTAVMSIQIINVLMGKPVSL